METAEPPQEGLVVAVYRSAYEVELPSGETVTALLPGKFFLTSDHFQNPLAVGDRVTLEKKDDTWTIVRLLPRRNYLVKRSVHVKSKIQILAANLDQALLIATITKPFTPLTYIDKFTVTCEAYNVTPVIIFNKMDLLTKKKEKEKLEDYIQIYSGIGYDVYTLSAKDSSYRDLAIQIVKDKLTFLFGMSGAGKSSFVNLIDPSLNLKTQPLAKLTERGKHTTTTVRMYKLLGTHQIIDAPGVQEFSLVGIHKNELAQYFPEMRALLPSCKFHNCTHIHEPQCAVLEALELGLIPHTRYNTYLNMYYELDQLEIYDQTGR